VPPDCVRCTRGLHTELLTFGKIQRRSTIIHRTVRCTPDSVRCSKDERLRNSPVSGIRSAIIHRTVRCDSGATTTSRQRSPADALNARQSAQKSGTRDVVHRTLYSACLVRHRTSRRAQQSELQRSEPNGLVTWLAHRTLSGAPCDRQPHQTASLVVGAINTPTTPHSSHPSFPTSTTYKSSSIQF
jgi:hypothetical protein